MDTMHEKLSMIKRVNELYQNKKYQEIISLKNNILKFTIEENDIFLYEKIIKSAFSLDKYSLIIELSNKLNSSGYESYVIIYYSCLSFIALTNLYQANLYLMSSRLLSDASHKLLYASDGANYSNILAQDNKNGIYAMVMVNFVFGLCRETTRNNVDVNNEYLFYRVMDLLNVLVELNYPEEIVSKIYKDFVKIYKI